MKSKCFEDYLTNTALDINKFLENYNKELVSHVKSVNIKLEPLISCFTMACEGGKRLRGTLVKLGYDMISNSTDEILKPALAYEVFQTAILAHDDIIDQSSMRRNKPSMYKFLGGNHYGVSQTICLGDLGMFISDKLIAESNFEANAKNRALCSFIKTQYNTVIGELLDVELPYHEKLFITLEDILTIYEYKTAYYTIVGPLHLGAILAGGETDLLVKLEKFGKFLGIAFQIKDDILGIFGDKDVIGKSIMTDVEEGKITTLWHYAFHNANNNQKNILKNKYGKKGVVNSDLEDIKKVFIETKALSKSEEIISEYVNHAQNEIPQMPISAIHKKMLKELCDYMINRKK